MLLKPHKIIDYFVHRLYNSIGAKKGDSFMKWTKAYLEKMTNPSFKYQETLDFTSETFDRVLHLQSVKDVQVEGIARYDSFQECLFLDLTIRGTMVIPCARTLEPVDYSFTTNDSVVYSFAQALDEDTIIVKGLEIDTTEFVRQCIILEIPLKVVKPGSDYQKTSCSSDDDVDPRLAKLKDFFKDK